MESKLRNPIDGDFIAESIRRKLADAGGMPLKEAAKECGISASTLSRLQNYCSVGHIEGETMMRLATWLGVPCARLLMHGGAEARTLDLIDAKPLILDIIAADESLRPEVREALSSIFAASYDAAAKLCGARLSLVPKAASKGARKAKAA